MQQPLVSIIIPVYNAEKTILTALDSIPKREDIEVIIIDDKSTDDTRLICERWIFELDPTDFYSVQLITKKENGGCASAKNVGYDKATGEYIGSIDADDYYITEKAHELLYNLKNGLYNDYDIISITNEINNGEIGVGERPAAWAYLIRRKFLGDNRCPIQRRAADGQLYEKLKRLNPRVLYTDICCYHYNYMAEGSITWKHANGLTDDCGNDKIN